MALKYLIITFLIVYCNAVFRKNSIKLKNNGYENILIAIHDDVPENPALIERIRDEFTRTSKFLYASTRQRAYFRKIQILVPLTWKDKQEYCTAADNFYHNADIRVNPKNNLQDNSPYVKTYKGCGQPGEFMSMSDEYLRNRTESELIYGRGDKLLVHEWAHLRWGVFDEYPTGSDQHFYFSSFTESYEPTRCGRAIEGLVIKNTGSDWDRCTADGGNTYEDGCNFYPYISKTNYNRRVPVTSMMDRQYVETIETFCDDHDTDEYNVHNSEAPNKQNRLCNGRSTWDVISSTDDFQQGRNPARNISEVLLEPEFSVCRHRQTSPRVVLVLDQSASMKTKNRRRRMIHGVTTFINSYLQDGTEIGVVMFNTQSSVKMEIKKLTSAKDRSEVVNSVPRSSFGRTSIGAGLRKGLKMLQEKGPGGTLIVLSDGKENESPLIEAIAPSILAANVTVESIGFTKNAAGSMKGIAENTGGTFFYDSNSKSTTGLNGAMEYIANKLNSEYSLTTPLILVYLKSIDLSFSGKTFTDDVFINDGVGNRTEITIAYTTSIKSVNITSPSRISFTLGLPNVKHNARDKIITISVPGIAEAGRWSIYVENGALNNRVTISIKSYPTSKNDYIILRAYRNAVGTWPPKWTIIADASKGGKPVLGLNVTATVDRPGSVPVTIQLRDDGIGADIDANDGVYSRYFTNFTIKGRYSVSVNAEALPGAGRVLQVKAGQKSAVLIDPIKPSPEATEILKRRTQEKTVAETGGVSITSSSGALELNLPKNIPADTNLELTDLFGPAAITDLKVVSTNISVPSVTLSWSASGDDLDQGTATEYKLFYKDVNIPNSSWTAATFTDVLIGDLASPKSFGEEERYTILVPYKPEKNSSFVFYLRVFDDVGQSSLSNKVAAGLGNVPNLIEKTTRMPVVTTEEITTLKTETTAPDDTTTRIVTTDNTRDKITTDNVINVTVTGSVLSTILTRSNSSTLSFITSNKMTTSIKPTTKRDPVELSFWEENQAKVIGGGFGTVALLVLIIVIATVFYNKSRTAKINITKSKLEHVYNNDI